METLKDLLQARGNDEPPEIQIIKDYVQTNFKASVGVAVQQKQIVILASSAGLAGTLRLHSYEIAKLCKTDKRLVFRINA